MDSARFNGLTQIINPATDKSHYYFKCQIVSYKTKWMDYNWSNQVPQKEFRKDKIKYSLFSEDQNIPVRTVEHVLLHEYAHIFSFINHEAPLPGDCSVIKAGNVSWLEFVIMAAIFHETKKEGLENLEFTFKTARIIQKILRWKHLKN